MHTHAHITVIMRKVTGVYKSISRTKKDGLLISFQASKENIMCFPP